MSKARLDPRAKQPNIFQRMGSFIKNAIIFAFLLLIVVGMSDVFRHRGDSPQDAPSSAEAAVSVAQSTATPTRDPEKMLVGIVSGHSGYDSGAVCPDGLTEAEINKAISLEVIDLLHRTGIDAILLEEFDPRLTGLKADALVSIHADSCNIPGATGFKVARVTDSAIPQAEDALVQCIVQQYANETGLPLHPASVTDDMKKYHAFYEVAPETPGAIIETGFMLDDRYILEKRPKLVARGITAGILCFLNRLNDE